MKEHRPRLPEHHVLQQAAEWFARVTDEDATEREKTAWRVWLNQNAEHERAWQYVARVGQRFQQAQQYAGQDGTGRILKTTRKERISRRKLLGSGLACMAVWLSWRYTPLPVVSQRIASSWMADHHTAISETRQLSLADGGQLWLNTASAVNIDYREDTRSIRLYKGEILIQTAEDPGHRPLLLLPGRAHCGQLALALACNNGKPTLCSPSTTGPWKSLQRPVIAKFSARVSRLHLISKPSSHHKQPNAPGKPGPRG
nr:DUF4880 domain-containing protein [Nitrincola sp. A-D6]